jgi:hypothetical protein
MEATSVTHEIGTFWDMARSRTPDAPKFMSTQIRDFFRQILAEKSAGKRVSPGKDWAHGALAAIGHYFGLNRSYVQMVVDGDRNAEAHAFTAIVGKLSRMSDFFSDQKYAGQHYRELYPGGIPGLTGAAPAQPATKDSVQPYLPLSVFSELADFNVKADELRLLSAIEGVTTRNEIVAALRAIRLASEQGAEESRAVAAAKSAVVTAKAQDRAIGRGGRQVETAKQRRRAAKSARRSKQS